MVTDSRNSGGGIMAGGSKSSMNTGEHIIIGGLVVQILFFGFFILTILIFHIRMIKAPTSKVLDDEDPVARIWKRHMYALYTGSLLILVRSVFRLIEYAQGNDGFLISHEVFLYVFDSVFMVGVMVLFAIVHPCELGRLMRLGPNARTEVPSYGLK
jgi:tellurite resistance protein TehA-like permease